MPLAKRRRLAAVEHDVLAGSAANLPHLKIESMNLQAADPAFQVARATI